MKRLPLFVATLLGLCGPLIGEQRKAAERPPGQTPPPLAMPVKSAKPEEAPWPDVEPRAKVVEYGDKDVIRVNTKLRYTTLIVGWRKKRQASSQTKSLKVVV